MKKEKKNQNGTVSSSLNVYQCTSEKFMEIRTFAFESRFKSHRYIKTTVL